jgi:hypothetical protein
VIVSLSVTGQGWVTSLSGPLPAAVGCGLLLMIVSLRLGPGPGRDSADFLKASLEVQCNCGPAGEGHARHGPPFARPFRTVIAGSGGSLGICPGAAWQRPEPTPTQTFVARPAHRPRGTVGRGGLTCPSRSAETYPLSGDRGISVESRRVPPAPGRPQGAAAVG